jgi:MFS family permease
MVAQAVSVTGTQVTALAIPTLAILVLHADPLAAAFLFALEYGVQGLTAPVAGVLVDRAASRRRLLVSADILQVLVIASVPVVHAAGHLTLGQLYGVTAVSAVLGGVSAIGVPALVPDVASRDQLVSANSRIAGARSVGEIAGPGVAAFLVQGIGAAAAMTADAVSYGVSALTMLIPRLSASRRSGEGLRRESGILQSVREGWQAVRGEPVLARLAVAAAALNLGGAGLGGLYTYFAYRIVRLTPLQVGATFAAYSIAAVAAVITAKRVVRRLGLRRIIPFFGPVAAAALLLIPAASLGAGFPVLIAYELIFGYCATVWAVSSVTLQQLLSPPARLGRVLGWSRSLSMLTLPAGALIAGALAGPLGLTVTLLIFAVVALAGTLAVVTIREGRKGGRE